MKNKHRSGRVLANCAMSLILVVPATAWAVDWFLKIDGVKGESTAEGHKDELDIDSFSWGVRGGASKAMGAPRAASSACMHTMAFARSADSATPQLLTKAAMGTIIPKATLTGRRAGDSKAGQDFLKVELTNVFVSSVQHSGSSDSLYESFDLRFSGAKVSYSPQDPKTGSLGKAIESNVVLPACD